MERKLQSDIIKWLKGQGCYVIKHTVISGVPAGTPDLSFYKGSLYGFIEVKASQKSRYQPLQKENIARFDEWSFGRAVYPENWESTREELATLLSP